MDNRLFKAQNKPLNLESMKAVILYMDSVINNSGSIIDYRDEKGNVLEYSDVLKMVSGPFDEGISFPNRCPDTIFFIGSKNGPQIFECTYLANTTLEACKVNAAGSSSIGVIRYVVEFGPTSAKWNKVNTLISN